MFGRTDHTTTHADGRKGLSLARGPAWITGLVLSAAGLILFFKSPGTPLGTGNFPDGFASGDSFLGFETNAWTAWGTTAAGILVLIGAAQHALAKTMSLLTGLLLGAASVIALADGDDVLGLAAANGWTALAWGVAAAILLVTALLPRTAGEAREERADDAIREERDVTARRGAATGAGSTADGLPASERPVTTATPAHADADRPAVAPAQTTPMETSVSGDAAPRSDALRRTYRPSTPEEEAERVREAEAARRR